VTMTGNQTCPKVCPFNHANAGGCYAETGPVSWHWKKVSNGSRAVPLADTLSRIAALPDSTLWRHNVAGDLPGDGERIDSKALADIARANAGKRGFTYTHYSPTRSNITAIRKAVAAGFTINLSANNAGHADQLAEKGLPVVCVLPADISGRQSLTTPQGSPHRRLPCYLSRRYYVRHVPIVRQCLTQSPHRRIPGAWRTGQKSRLHRPESYPNRP
jgi:hypothetical protein